MKYTALNFQEKLSKFSDCWSPKVIAEMNDQQFKLVKVKGAFVWHDHKDTDAVLIVIDGQIIIEFRDGAVESSTGEMFVFPKGIEHEPYAEKECHMLLIEPQGVVNTGDTLGEKAAQNDIWI